MKTRPVFSPDPSYSWMHGPQASELLYMNSEYKSKILGWPKEYASMKAILDQRKNDLNERSKTSIVPSHEWRAIDHDIEFLSLEVARRKTLGDLLKEKIEFNAGRFAALYKDILNDYEGSYISIEGLKSYLKTYSEVIQSGNNLPCFESKEFEKIKTDIKKYLENE